MQRLLPRTFPILLGLIVAADAATAAPSILTTAQWRADLEQLLSAIRAEHPIPAGELADSGIEAAAADLAKAVPERSDHAIVLAMAELVARLGDGHSRLTLPMAQGGIGLSDAHSETPPPTDPRLAFRRYPFVVRAFDDGFFVTGAAEAQADLLGRELLAMNDLVMADVVARLEPLAHGENAGWKRRIIADRLTIPEVLRFAGVIGDEAAKFRFSAAQDGRTDRVLRPLATAEPAWRTLAPGDALRHRHAARAYWFEPVDEHRAVYVQFRAAEYRPEHPPMDFAGQLWTAAAKPQVDRLVLDLRDNRGGDATWTQPLLAALVRHPRLNHPGRLYVLIGPDTFSAAMLMANELEQHSHALFVGAATGNSPDHYGDARRTRLDQSGLTVRLSTLHWKSWLGGEFRTALAPHLPAPRRFSDWRAGRDPALELAMTHRLEDPLAFFRHLLVDVDVNAAAVFLSRLVMDPRLDLNVERRLLELGVTLREAGDLVNSRYVLLLAETFYSGSAEVLRAYAETLEALGREEEAAAAFQRAQAREGN